MFTISHFCVSSSLPTVPFYQTHTTTLTDIIKLTFSPLPFSDSSKLKAKLNREYANVKHLSTDTKAKKSSTGTTAAAPTTTSKASKKEEVDKKAAAASNVMIEDVEEDESMGSGYVENLVEKAAEEEKKNSNAGALILHGQVDQTKNPIASLIKAQRSRRAVKPKWHAPWKLMRVIAGHIGHVRSVAMDPTNEWFCTGSADRTIKIWDLASGSLKLTLTGHINAVMGVAVSHRHPYLFSVGLDKMVRCWDLEYNKTIRSYHGHLSGVYTCKVHPTLDLLVTGGRDSTARVWDIRTKSEVYVLGGHKHTVAAVITQPTDPQVVTGSHDTTMRLWDLRKGQAYSTLTYHKKSVRSLAGHPTEYTFVSGAADNIKVWKCPEGKFMRNFSGHNAIVNTVAVNRDDVCVSAADNGSMRFWDWQSGHCFQQEQTIPQPGSLDSEAGIYEAIFDVTGSRLITAEADKSIKVWKEDPDATPETHPVDWDPKKQQRTNF